MTYMRLCDDCDRVPEYPDSFYHFKIEGFSDTYGYITEQVAQTMTWDDENWQIDHDKRTIKLLGSSLESRRAAIDQTLAAEREKDTFRVLRKWTGERFPVYGKQRELIVDVERAAATLFGIVTYGVHLIVYRDEPDEGLSIWAARRSANKVLFPNRLGMAVGGSLPSGESPFECLVRESYEEASLPTDLVRGGAKAVGTISYVTASETKTTSGGEAGLIRAEVQYLYELKAGPDVKPVPYDNEASDISLYSIDEIRKGLDDGEFTPADGCIMLDFFIRHGLVTFENEENYSQIIMRLHRSLGMQTA